MSRGRREQVFWGWGEPGAGPQLAPEAAEWLRARFGAGGGVVDRPVAMDEVRLDAPALPDGLRERLAAICSLRDDREARVLRAAGKSYEDLLAQRAGDCRQAPDAVVAPASAAEALAVLRACNDAGVAVVPFGGGTSVVGGVAPLRAGRPALVSLDLGRMDAVLSVDERSLVARVQPGLRLPEVEHRLGARGLTLGHFPQSFEWATVGGCVATRSAGQASTGFGRIADNVVAVRLASPMGELGTPEVPASAAGPPLRELLVGSEGAFGVLTEIALRVRPAPRHRRYEGFFARGFGEGCEVLRALAQDGLAPDVARLSDEPETALTLATAGRHGVRARLGTGLLRARGYAEGCLLVCGWEGDSEAAVRRRRSEAARRMRAAGVIAVGAAPGRAWLASRYSGPHQRDALLDRGMMVDTLEAAATWTRLEALREAVRAALGDAHVGCHVSHLYPTGASLYFTVLARRDTADPLGQWRALKASATEAILAGGGTLTHHHAVGRDHAPWLAAEDGAVGVDVLRAAKQRLDPAGIMNPGKLLPTG